MSSDRQYQSSLRDEQARQTRLRIRRAARTLFASRGFTNTPVTEIAVAAEVSPATVYAIFESKAGIVSAMLEDMEEGAALADKMQAILATPDPRMMLRQFLSAHCDLFEDGADILRAAMRAIEHPEVAALAAQGDAHRRAGVEAVVAQWEAAGLLAPGLSPASAADQLWLLTTVEGWLNAVDRLGWTRERYESWLCQLAERTLAGK